MGEEVKIKLTKEDWDNFVKKDLDFLGDVSLQEKEEAIDGFIWTFLCDM